MEERIVIEFDTRHKSTTDQWNNLHEQLMTDLREVMKDHKFYMKKVKVEHEVL